MRILQIASLLGAGHGGAAQATYRLAKELASRGHQVGIYASDYKLNRNSIPPIAGVKIRTFKTWLHLVGFNITPSMILANAHPDIIHMHNYRTFQNIVAHYYAKKHNVPYILQGRGSLTTFFYKGWLKHIFDKVWGYTLLNDASKVIAVTETEANQCLDMGVSEGKITIVPNGIDLAEFENLPERGKFRRKYGLTDQKLILYLGRIHKIKGLDLLAEAFPVVLDYLNDARLVFVGSDDGFLASLTKLIADLGISDKVLFTGLLTGQEKLEAYVDADVYVLPSYYETFPHTVLEACACGVPIVMTDCCGIAQVIDRQAGFAVPRDKQSLANAISNVLYSDETSQLFSKRGKALVREKFNWSMITNQIEAIYREEITKRQEKRRENEF